MGIVRYPKSCFAIENPMNMDDDWWWGSWYPHCRTTHLWIHTVIQATRLGSPAGPEMGQYDTLMKLALQQTETVMYPLVIE